MPEETRLFYIVDSIEDNEEIFLTYQEALKYYKEIDNKENKTRLYIAEVNNSYYDKEAKAWNYNDLTDTFRIIHIMREHIY